MLDHHKQDLTVPNMGPSIHAENRSSPFTFGQPTFTFGKPHGIDTSTRNNPGPFPPLFCSDEKTEQLHEYIKQMEREKSELEGHCSKLLSECKRLQSVVLQQRERVLGSLRPKWFPKEDHTIQFELTKLQTSMRSWSREYSLADESEIEKVPAAEKNMLIKQLEGYCVQSDWYSLIKQIPLHQTKLSSVLVQAALAKTIFQGVFTDPFFFIDTRNNNMTGPGSPSMASIYETLMQSKPLDSRILEEARLTELS
jgi:hypothetical protein